MSDNSHREISSMSSRALPIGGLLVFGFLASIGVVLWLAFAPGSPDTFIKPALTVVGPSALLAPETDSPAEVIALAYDVIAERYVIARLDPANHRVAWRGKALKEIGDLSAITIGVELFFTAEGTQLNAYRTKDGSPVWQADLSDKLGYCAECLSTSGNRVITLTQDYYLQAFDTETGASAWRRRLAGYTNGFSVVNDSLLLIDKEQDEFGLLLLSLADGSVVRQIAPECKTKEGYNTEQLDSSSRVVLDPESAGRIYLIYGFSPGCIEGWDLNTGKRIWQSMDEYGYSSSQDYSTLLTPETLFFAADNNLWAAEKADGRTRRVTQAEDYDLVPLALADNVLIVRTKRTRGTTQFGLWGMDPTYGEKIWQYIFKTGAPLDPPDDISGFVDGDQTAWTWRVAAGQMILMEFQAEPNQMTFHTINPRDGIPTDGKTLSLPVEGDYYTPPTILAWQDSIAWLIVDTGILGIDFMTENITFGYP